MTPLYKFLTYAFCPIYSSVAFSFLLLTYLSMLYVLPWAIFRHLSSFLFDRQRFTYLKWPYESAAILCITLDNGTTYIQKAWNNQDLVAQFVLFISDSDDDSVDIRMNSPNNDNNISLVYQYAVV